MVASKKHRKIKSTIPRQSFSTRLPPQRQRNLCQPLRNLSRALQGPHEPRKIRPKDKLVSDITTNDERS